jgi:hypothetical protein
MAEMQSMTTAEVVAKTLITEHADFLRDAVALVARELMEAEITTVLLGLAGGRLYRVVDKDVPRSRHARPIPVAAATHRAASGP